MMAAVIFAWAVHSVGAEVIYVRAGAQGADTGRSWEDAHSDLQDALGRAVRGDQIWVARGSYCPTATGDRDAAFDLVSGTALYGGFEGAETDRSERKPQLHETILDGNIGDPDARKDNCRRVVRAVDVDANTVLDGFMVQNAYNELLDERGRGGGIYVFGSPESLLDSGS